MALLKYNGKIVLFNGAFTSAQDFTAIEIGVSGSTFPDGKNSAGRFQVSSLEAGNTMYVDFNDGTGEHAFAPNSGNNHLYRNNPLTILHTYQDGNTRDRKINIRFKDASKITRLVFDLLNFNGLFPKALANYNLTLGLEVSADVSRFSDFPTDFRSVNSMSVVFRNLVTNKVINLVPWVYSSKIQNLVLDGVFNLSALPNVNRTDKLIDVVGLKELTLSNSNLNSNSLPSNLKDINTLEYLRIGGNTTLTTLPTALAGCANIKTLHLGSSDGYGSSYLTSWGTGITGMTNLTTLTNIAASSGILLETNVPTGLNTCLNLKNIDLRFCYATQVRIDEFVTNFYNYVVANSSLTNININIGFLNAAARSARPSGVYQTSATPTTPMEMIYKLVNDYRHTITVTNVTNNGNEVLTP